MTVRRAICTLAALVLLTCVSPAAPAQNDAPPNSPDLNRGIELYRQGKFAAASDLLKKIVKKTKTDDAAWYYLGLSLMKRKQLKDATKALETAVRLQPKSPGAHIALGYALILRDKNDAALQEALAAQAIDPRLVEAHYIAGVAHLRSDARDAALKEAETILQIDPKFASAYLLKSRALVSFFLGDVLFQDKAGESILLRYAQAGDALEKYLQLDTNGEDKEALTEQLESLRFFAAAGKGKTAYSAREVTTRARILSKPEPQYTERARSNQVTGTVVLRAVLADDGKVKHLIVVRDLPDGLTERALSVARLIRFVPATLNGRSVSTFVQLEYNFNLY